MAIWYDADAHDNVVMLKILSCFVFCDGRGETKHERSQMGQFQWELCYVKLYQETFYYFCLEVSTRCALLVDGFSIPSSTFDEALSTCAPRS
jgi:hypothetical protein